MSDIFDVMDAWYRPPQANTIVDAAVKRVEQMVDELGHLPAFVYVPIDVYDEFVRHMYEWHAWRLRCGYDTWENDWRYGHVYRIATMCGEVAIRRGYGYMVKDGDGDGQNAGRDKVSQRVYG